MVIVFWNRTADDAVRVALPRPGRVVEYRLDGVANAEQMVSEWLEVRLRRGIPRIFELR